MTREVSTRRSRLYWQVWFLLLVLTLTMVFLDQASISRLALVLMLVVAMLGKASLIGAYFMHLRFERLALVASVAVGLLVTGLLLFSLIAPDGVGARY
ncbi:MAG: cytochrome C oxidase subunit IV family protein [Acidobacteriota bacterium]